MARKKPTDIKWCAWTRKSCRQNCNAKDSCKRASGKMLTARFIQNIRTEPRQRTSFWSGEMSLTMHGRTVPMALSRSRILVWRESAVK